MEPREPRAWTTGAGTFATGSLRLRLVDGVTGSVLVERVQRNAREPVSVVVCEHFVVLSYWQEDGQQSELVVLEAFESATPDQRDASYVIVLALPARRGQCVDERAPLKESHSWAPSVVAQSVPCGPRRGRSTFSSHDRLRPAVLSQAFVLPNQPLALGVTQTRHGITSRLILGPSRRRGTAVVVCATRREMLTQSVRCRGSVLERTTAGLNTNQVYSLSKRLLDVRRPARPLTSEDTEEGLLRYAPALPLDGRAFVSYNQTVRAYARAHAHHGHPRAAPRLIIHLAPRTTWAAPNLAQVARIRMISTAPAQLESATLVLVAGLDLFYTRLSPSNVFDSLTDDFHYIPLVLTLVGLVVATTVTCGWARAAILRERWR